MLIKLLFFLMAFSSSISSRTTLVTGGTGTIGSAVVETLIRSTDNKVFVGYRNVEKLRKLGWLNTENSAIIPMHVNFREDLVDQLVLPPVFTSERFPSFCLINNAGIFLEGRCHDAFKESLRVNCLAPAMLTEQVFSAEKQWDNDAADVSRTIVNISSGEGELIFLHSRLQRELQSIDSFEVGPLYYCF
jgi:NAD(P)-dependent dehydrogenase (short-subunit alcohol dehydrogenase family)